MKNNVFWNLPNNLTLYRIATIPALIIFMLFPNKICSLFSAILFSIASITDCLDGFFARRRHLVSTLGKFLDPLADKLLISAALIMLIPLGRVPAWMVFIVIGRELAVTGLRGICSAEGVVISATSLGKYKVGFQIAAIIPLLLHYTYFNINFHVVGMFFFWCAVGFTIWSGVDYFKKFYVIIRK
ncbi:MAG: CDP-diacylglycerol--glycerol-3-phosphate 3-phosphatidyltransferase [Deltaproteobacteria bacterium]|nr:CDP-diacylglycerol--glycerol-3-phosphate 3-phosphatidyltransferase [Deltaproteobacteria bacterium]